MRYVGYLLALCVAGGTMLLMSGAALLSLLPLDTTRDAAPVVIRYDPMSPVINPNVPRSSGGGSGGFSSGK